MSELREELLESSDVNVIIVDRMGGNVPPYRCRAVGAEVAIPIQKLIVSLCFFGSIFLTSK